jgi:hypothetical protein
MQIKRNQRMKNHNLIWQKKVLGTIVTHCLTILVLSVIIITTPSLSSQSQTNDSGSHSSDRNDNNNNTNSSQIAVFSANSKFVFITRTTWISRRIWTQTIWIWIWTMESTRRVYGWRWTVALGVLVHFTPIAYKVRQQYE